MIYFAKMAIDKQKHSIGEANEHRPPGTNFVVTTIQAVHFHEFSAFLSLKTGSRWLWVSCAELWSPPRLALIVFRRQSIAPDTFVCISPNKLARRGLAHWKWRFSSETVFVRFKSYKERESSLNWLNTRIILECCSNSQVFLWLKECGGFFFFCLQSM